MTTNRSVPRRFTCRWAFGVAVVGLAACTARVETMRPVTAEDQVVAVQTVPVDVYAQPREAERIR